MSIAKSINKYKSYTTKIGVAKIASNNIKHLRVFKGNFQDKLTNSGQCVMEINGQSREDKLTNSGDERKQRAFYMASYDIDRFRDFVFKSGFLDKFDVEPSVVENIQRDEIALLHFAFSYLKYILMMEETLRLKS